MEPLSPTLAKLPSSSLDLSNFTQGLTSVEVPIVDEAEAYLQKLEKTRLLREKLKQEYTTKRDAEVLFEESKDAPHEEKPSIYNFLPVALLGEGSYGQVYLVEDINSEK